MAQKLGTGLFSNVYGLRSWKKSKMAYPHNLQKSAVLETLAAALLDSHFTLT
jgi:hypothetical protein